MDLFYTISDRVFFERRQRICHTENVMGAHFTSVSTSVQNKSMGHKLNLLISCLLCAKSGPKFILGSLQSFLHVKLTAVAMLI